MLLSICYYSIIPRCSMSGTFTYIYPKNCPNVGKYSIHGASGIHYHRNNIADSLIFLLLTSCYRKIPHVTCDLDLLGVADPEAPPKKMTNP